MIHTVQLKKIPFSVEESGKGAPLLFIHGFPLDHTMWQAQYREFQSRYRVIAPDLRGFGLSEGSQEEVTMKQYADDLIQLLNTLKILEPVTVIGLSMGGYIAFQMALHYEDRVARLVLCDTRAQTDDAEGKLKRSQVAEKVVEEGPGFLVESMIEKLFAPATQIAAPELIEKTRQVIRQTFPLAIAGASRGMATRPDVRAELPKIDIPTLVVCGTEDAIVPVDEMRAIAQEMPRAEFVEIAGAGHMAPLENPQAFNMHLSRFLGATDV